MSLDDFNTPVPENLPQPPPAENPPPTIRNPQSEPLPVSNPLASLVDPGNRRKGKVARKTNEVRNRINSMILDGVPYADIIAALGEEGKDLNDQNLTNWRMGGYQDWLRDHDCFEAQRARNEAAADLAFKQGSKIHQATIQVAAANMLRLVLDLKPSALQHILEDDPDKYTRILNALVRLSDGQLRCEQHQVKQEQQTRTSARKEGGISQAKLAQAKEALELM
jgi:hypothetical protein